VHELTVKARFSAAHALVIQGTREPLHGHDWRVTATIAGDSLDADGLLCDFHAIKAALRTITRRLNTANLNEIEPFDQLNPSAEHVAQHIAERLAAALTSVLPEGARVASVRVTEAPGCAATYSMTT
jgi:6-pyruvoyltetrahydropterin/6-carboxytetrahydropterin synthase